jgi:microcystin-dependent protein
VTLNQTQMPLHGHTLNGLNTSGAKLEPTNDWLANVVNDYDHYAPATPSTLVPLNPASIQPVGGQPHNNIQPYLTVNICIALTGVFPSRN